MKLSKYINFIKIQKNVYAVYNRFMFEPVFFTYKEKQNLAKENFHFFTKQQIRQLKTRGIIVNDYSQDKLAFNSLKDYVENEIKEKISLMYIIGNNNCNMACKYCFIGELNNSNPIYMDKKTLELALYKFNKHLEEKNLKKGIIVFYGGEPLLNFDLIRHAVKTIKTNKYRIQISLVSNGLLLTEKIAKFIKNNNIGIGISIDGPKNLNDLNRIIYKTNEGTYDIVMSKIKLFQKLKIPFGLSITINDYALDNPLEYLEWLKNTNVKEITYNLMHYNNKNDNWKEYYAKIANFLYHSKQYLKQFNVNEGRIKRKYDAFYKREFKYSDCGAIGANQIALKPNGDITICHGLWNCKEKLGNITKIDFNDIFKTSMYKNWNQNITLNKKVCIRCPYIYMCGGGCAMESKKLFGKEKKIDKPFCQFTKDITKLILQEFYQLSTDNKKD